MRKLLSAAGALSLAVASIALAPGMASPPRTPGLEHHAAPKSASAARAPGEWVPDAFRLPGGLRFESNRGQAPGGVSYVLRGRGLAGHIGPTGAQTWRPGGAQPLRMHLKGARNDARPAGISRLSGRTNYVKGNDPSRWVKGVPSYARVRFVAVYPGIDIVYYGNEGSLQYDFVVGAGRDPSDITLAFPGSRSLKVAGGRLVVGLKGEDVSLSRPVAYQVVAGARSPVKASFSLSGSTVKFAVGRYDRSKPLIIDPVIEFSTYLGGAGDDAAAAVVADASGVYVAGETSPVDSSPGAPGREETDAFVAKFDRQGRLVFATYLGGSNFDSATAMARDPRGGVFVAGNTSSGDFPVLGDVFQKKAGGNPEVFLADAFVARFDATSETPVFSTYFGGGGAEKAAAITADSAGNAFLVGTSGWFLPDGSETDPAPYRSGADGSHGENDYFVAKMNGSGTQLLRVTFLGGSRNEGLDQSGFDSGAGVQVDTEGRVYLTGRTHSDNFPTTPNAYMQDAPPCALFCGDAFLAVFDSSLSHLNYSSYLGGTGEDQGTSLSVRSEHEVIVGGMTRSADFPLREPIPQGSGPEPSCVFGSLICFEAFVSEMDTVDGTLRFSTLLGGSHDDYLRDLGTDTAGNIYVTGGTMSADFPETGDAYRPIGGKMDGFLSVIGPSRSSFTFSTRLGGSSNDEAARLSQDGSGSLYLAGHTISQDFPVTNAFQPGPGAAGATTARDAFIVKLSDAGVEAPLVLKVDPLSGPTSGGFPAVIYGRGFTGATSVTFDGRHAAFTVDAPDRITTTVPEHRLDGLSQGRVLVTVTTPRGTSGRSPGAYFYYSEGMWRVTGEGLHKRGRHTASLLHNGKVLVAGGCVGPGGTSTSPCASSEIFDPISEKWTVTGPGDADVLVATTLPNSGAAVCGADCGKVLAVGETTTQLYDPLTGTWSPTAPAVSVNSMILAVPGIAGLPDGRVLLFGGTGTGGCADHPTTGALAEIYDPLARAWQPASTPAHARGRQTLAARLHNGEVLALGGYRDTQCDQAPDGPVAPAEIFSSGGRPSPGAWRPAGDQGIRRYWGATASEITATAQSRCGALCGRTLVVGGRVATFQDLTRDVEVYDPAANGGLGAWSAASPFPSPVSGHAAAALPNGKVLIAGGQGGLPYNLLPLATAHVFDPGVPAIDSAPTGKWWPAGSMSQARGGSPPELSLDEGRPPTATLLSADPFVFKADAAVCGNNCGKVLVVGGSGNKVTELYTPAPTVDSLQPLQVPASGGTSVRITGTGFTHNVQSVTFGGVPALDFKVDSYYQITAIAPPAIAKEPSEVAVVNEGGRAVAADLIGYLPGPGAVTDLAALPISRSQVVLSFTAPGSFGNLAPPARHFTIKQSATPIRTETEFALAPSLCEGPCDLSPGAVGDLVEATITGLAPATTYHYALRPLDENGDAGPMSNPASATTLPGTALPVPPPSGPKVIPAPCGTGDTGNVEYPEGYSLIGLPAGTQVPSGSPLYGWIDQPSGGAYSVQPPLQGAAGGHGYWAWFPCARRVSAGTGTPALNLPLSAYRASMVGNPSGTAAAIVTGHGFAAVWDRTANDGAGGYRLSRYRQPQTIEVGRGVWVFSYVNTTIKITAVR